MFSLTRDWVFPACFMRNDGNRGRPDGCGILIGRNLDQFGRFRRILPARLMAWQSPWDVPHMAILRGAGSASPTHMLQRMLLQLAQMVVLPRTRQGCAR